MIKLILTDMDGTLLNDNNEINKEFYPIFNKLLDKNIIFGAASGRQYYNLLDRFDKVKENMLFVAENGTYVVYKGKELIINSLERDIAMEIVKIARNIENAFPILCGKEGAYIEKTDPRLLVETKKYYTRHTVVDDLTMVEDEILKVAICDFSGSEINSLKYYNDYTDKVKVAVSGRIWLDITNKNANKGFAVKKLQELFKIRYEETMVFGDYLNDLEMMKSAFYSFAMENAHEDLKKVSRFITKSNNENGVVDTIKEVALNNNVRRLSIEELEEYLA
ncbi:MAG: HAD family phosphatase [Clostridiales bacterium]|nr:HAD family phosphatase [Clostridiales bacterium]